MGGSAGLFTQGGEEDYIACELCRESLHQLSLEDRQIHYEAHFNKGDGLEINEVDAQIAMGLTQGSPSKHKYNPAGRSNTIQSIPIPQKLRENAFWHSACPLPPTSRIITPGIVEILTRALERPGSAGGALCVPLVTHYGTELWDLGWGCGYRNFLMACSALAAQSIRPEYQDLLMNDTCGPPGVRNLQAWIEDAWRRGYDAHGAGQLRNRLVGTRKWIGTAELYVAFTSRGIPARLVDFPNNGCAHIALVQWITMHFTGTSNDISSSNEPKSAAPRGVYISSRMPIVLQHKGHSRTVVGVEYTPSGQVNLLIFDPAWRASTGLRKAGLRVHEAGFSSSNSNAPPEPETHHHHYAPTKAKEFFKRVIKRRSRTPLNDKAPERVRGGSTEPNDWEATDKGKGHKLGGGTTESQARRVSVSEPKVDLGTSMDKKRGRKINLVPPDVIQGLDLGRVVSTFRVTPSQLSKKSQYQILWFPMTAPLTGPERDKCKVVRSERITVSLASEY